MFLKERKGVAMLMTLLMIILFSDELCGVATPYLVGRDAVAREHNGAVF